MTPYSVWSQAARSPAATDAAGRVPRSMRRGVAVIAMAAMLVACGGSPRQLDDGEKITRSVLALLSSTGRPVCIDDHTEDDALAVFRQMTRAPRPSRAQLHWSPPTPLQPDVRVTTRELRATELSDEEMEIPEPGARREAMPGLDQLYYDGAARRLMAHVGSEESSVAIRKGWAPPGVTARWWPLNRIGGGCWPLFAISNPVRDRQVAFVAVRAEHWGTLYAIRPQGDDWQVTAEWSRWLY